MKQTLTTAAFALLTALCAFALLVGPSISHAGVLGPPPNPDIKVVIEAPKGDVAGVIAIQGFAFSSNGIDRVEWSLDGKAMGTLPHGGSRGDVPPVYPGYPTKYTQNSGFSATWFMGLLTPGDHEIIVSAYDVNGGVNADSVDFTSYKFANFIKQGDMKLQNFVIENVVISDASTDFYDVEFSWSQAGQTWEISGIEKSCDGSVIPCAALLITAPTSLVASSGSGPALANFIQLDWDAPSNGNLVGYEIQRRQVFGAIVGGWMTIGFSPAYASDYADYGATTILGDQYEYRVRGFDGVGPGDWSQTTIIPAPAPGPGPIFP